MFDPIKVLKEVNANIKICNGKERPFKYHGLRGIDLEQFPNFNPKDQKTWPQGPIKTWINPNTWNSKYKIIFNPDKALLKAKTWVVPGKVYYALDKKVITEYYSLSDKKIVNWFPDYYTTILPNSWNRKQKPLSKISGPNPDKYTYWCSTELLFSHKDIEWWASLFKPEPEDFFPKSY